MSNLPKGWIETSIGEIAIYVQRGKSPQYTSFSDLVVINQKCVRWHGLEKEHVKFVHREQWQSWDEERHLKDGDILWNSTGTGTIGRACIYKQTYFSTAVVDSHVTIIRFNQNYIFPTYVFYFIASPLVQKKIESMQSGSTNQVELGRAAINEMRLPLPPLNEQKRIVAKIEELFSKLDSAIESLKTARAQLKLYRQAVLKHAFEGKLTAEWRERNKDKLESAEQILERVPSHRCINVDSVTQAEFEKLPKLPTSWRYARLGYFIEAVNAGKSFKCDEREPRQDEVGVAKVSAVTWGEYDEHESKTCIDSVKINPDLFIRPGDFLFSRANTIDLVGACVIAKTATKHIMLSDKTLRIQFRDLEPYYFLYYLRSQMGRNEIMQRSTGNQESMRNIGQDRIRNIIIPICSPREAIQIKQELREKFTILDNLAAVIDIELQKSEALRQSVLKKAFSGQLVPQNPADEPASVLLERIRAEKIVTKSIPQKTKRRVA